MSKRIERNEIVEQGVLDNLLEPLKKLITSLDEADKKLKGCASSVKDSVKSADDAKGMRELEDATNKTNKAFQQKLEIDKQREKLTKDIEKAEAKLVLMQSEEYKQLQKLKKEQKDQNQQLKDGTDAYKKLAKEVRDYKNKSKKLGAELLNLEKSGQKNTKAYKDLEIQYKKVTVQAQKGDAQLKKLDKTVGDNFRNVGNYEKATRGLSKALGALGVAFGFSEIAKGFFNFNRELSKATNTAQTLFKTTEEGGKAIAQQAMTLSKVYGKDLNEVLRASNVLARQFGLTGEQSISLLNQGFEKGADLSGEFLENISEYSTQLRLAGLNAEQSISIITQAQQEGVFSDKGIDAIKEATLSLREMTKPAQEALQAIGMSSEQIQKDIASGAKTYFDVIQEISAETNKFGENSQEAGMILADIFKGAGEDAGDFIFKLGELNTELGDLENQNKGLDGAIKNLTRSWYDFIGGLNDSINSSNTFANIINFVAENLTKILGSLTRVGAYFLIYSTRLGKVTVQQALFNGGLKNMITAIPKMIRGLKTASISFRGLGNAMKSIPFVAIIGFAIELFYWLGENKDATDELTEAEKAYNDEVERGNNLRAERSGKIKDLTEQVKIAETLSQAQLKVLAQQLEQQIALSEENDKDIKTEKERIKTFEEYLSTLAPYVQVQENILKLEKELESAKGSQITQIQKQLAAEKALKKSIEEGQARSSYNKLITKGIKITDDEIKTKEELEAQLKRVNSLIKEETTNLNKNTTASNKNTEAKKKMLEADLSSLDEEMPDVQKVLDERLARLEESLQKQSKIRTKYNIENIQNEEKFNEAEKQNQIRLLDELIQVRKDYGKETIDLEIERANLLKSQITTNNNDTKQSYEQLFNDIKALAVDAYTNMADNAIDALKQQEEASAQMYDALANMAAQGNITAQQSLAEQIKAQEDAQKAQMEIEKKKQKIQLISQGLGVFGSLLDSGQKPTEALANTAVSMSALVGLINSLPSFDVGTENTGKNGKGVDGKGGFISILHPNERVMTAEQNAMTAGLSNPMLADVAYQFKTGQLVPASKANNSAVVNRLDSLYNLIEKQPQMITGLEQTLGGMMKLIVTEKKGHHKNTNTYKS